MDQNFYVALVSIDDSVCIVHIGLHHEVYQRADRQRPDVESSCLPPLWQREEPVVALDYGRVAVLVAAVSSRLDVH